MLLTALFTDFRISFTAYFRDEVHFKGVDMFITQ